MIPDLRLYLLIEMASACLGFSLLFHALLGRVVELPFRVPPGKVLHYHPQKILLR